MQDAMGAYDVGGDRHPYLQEGLHGHKFCGCTRMKANRALDIFGALKHSEGNELWDDCGSGSAKTTRRAARALGVNWGHSLPGLMLLLKRSLVPSSIM